MKGTVLELVLDMAKNMYRTLSLQNNWGTAVKPVLPYKSMGTYDWLIVTFDPVERRCPCLFGNRRA